MSDPTSPDPLLSPYASPAGEATLLAVPAKPDDVPSAPPPRVWPVPVAFLAAAVAAIGSQIVLALVLLMWLVNQGHTVPEAAGLLIEKLTEPALFLLAGGVSQLMIGLASIIPACLSPEGFRQRLGLVAPAVRPGQFLVLVLSVYFPTAIGLALAYGVVQIMPPDKTAEMMYAKMTWQWSVPFVLFIAFAPGFFEEMLFRGYMQRRLEKRLSPALAIGIASALFALLHVSPQVVVFAFPIGLWFGYISWRTGSIWPTIAAHAFVNGTWNIFNLSMKFKLIPEIATVPMLIGMAALGLCFFVPSLWILSGIKRLERTLKCF